MKNAGNPKHQDSPTRLAPNRTPRAKRGAAIRSLSAGALSTAQLLSLSGCMMNTPNPQANQNDNTASRMCDATDSRVGQTATLSTLAHNVSGTAVIVDDCTIEIRNFTYDGGGPDVVVYGDVDRNFATPLILSENLSGTPFNGGTLTVKLPGNASLDDVRAISIWCLQFDVNFGDGVFQ